MLRRLLASAAAVAACAAPLLHTPRPLLAWNASASAPRGLYIIGAAAQPAVDALTLVRPPLALARFLGARGYVPASVPLLKRIAAVAPQTVCRRGLAILIDDHAVARAFRRDRLGRPLPAWRGCRRLRRGEVFLLNADAPYSLDSRYFGPLPASSIIGRASPLWVEGMQ
jgi:conjugative transfer signal peptidase TraF